MPRSLSISSGASWSPSLYHGLGFGRRAIELLVTYVKTRPQAKELLVSCRLGEGSPVGFYEKCGFVRNGKTYGEEIGLTMLL